MENVEIFPGSKSLVKGTVPSSSIVLIGPPGVGKTTFCKQFLFNGLLMDEPSIYVTTQESPEEIENSQKALVKAVEGFAREISEKYIEPPYTTDFGIMFLPVESLYAEVLRHPGLFETLQRKYKITITGPTTLSALMNSLHMGFRTLAVQKRSSEVWNVLGAVKSEFSKFSEQLSKVQKQLHTASGSLETLRGTRTKQIERKLQNVEMLDPLESREVLELPSESEEDEPADE